MPGTRWVRLTAACVIARRTQNPLYAAADRGEVRTRLANDGKLEFLVEDLKRLRTERAAAPESAPAA